MARPKANSTASTENKIKVEAAENKETVINTEEEKTDKSDSETVINTEEEKVKKIPENKIVTIINPKYRYSHVRMNMQMYEFDGNGTASVNGKTAEEFLKLPGFSIVK